MPTIYKQAFVSAVVALILCLPANVQAQTLAAATDDEAPARDKIPTYRLTVSPATEPSPALKYHFLVPPVDQVRGNAATLYYKAQSFEGPDMFAQTRNDERTSEWMELPIDKLPIDEVSKAIGWLDNPRYLDDLRRAARCDHVDWEDNIRELGIDTPLPQAQKIRSLAFSLALLARLQIANHRYADAIETLRLGYALSRALGHTPTLVQGLIGMAIQGMQDSQVRSLIESPDSPNLYWALTDLAAQPIDIRQAMSYESRFWEFTIHELPTLGQQAWTPEQVLAAAKKIYGLNDSGPKPPATRDAEILLYAVQHYPAARAYLIEHGSNDKLLDAMPPLQVVLLYRWRQFELLRDEEFKWSFLPADASRDVVQRGERAVQLKLESGECGPFAEALPAVPIVRLAQLRSQRRIAALRAVEALRMHAAEHSHWPASLEEVQSVPVPTDPWTKRPFEYSVDKNVAALVAPLDPAHPPEQCEAARYELTLRKRTDEGPVAE